MQLHFERHGGNVELQSGAQVLAQGGGAASAGGSVQVLAQGDATLASGSLIDASAGQSGDGGFVEFSAKRHVDLAGGVLQARATLGQNGSVLVDPATVTVSDLFAGAVVPGLLLVGLYVGYLGMVAAFFPKMSPAIQSDRHSDGGAALVRRMIVLIART